MAHYLKATSLQWTLSQHLPKSFTAPPYKGHLHSISLTRTPSWHLPTKDTFTTSPYKGNLYNISPQRTPSQHLPTEDLPTRDTFTAHTLFQTLQWGSWWLDWTHCSWWSPASSVSLCWGSHLSSWLSSHLLHPRDEQTVLTTSWSRVFYYLHTSFLASAPLVILVGNLAIALAAFLQSSRILF